MAPADRPGDRAPTLDELVGQVARRLRRAMVEALTPWEIAPGQFRALRMIEQHESLRLTDLAGHLGITPRSTTEVVDALEQRGLVTRSADPEDRRAVRLGLTERGRAASAAVQATRAAEADRLFGVLSPADQARLRRILSALAHDPDHGGA